MTDIYLTIKPQRQAVAHRWKTSILKGMKGKEQRSALFTWPRVDTSLFFRSANDYKTNWIRRNMSKYSHKVWGVPIWHDHTELSANAGVSTLNIPCEETDYRHFYPGRKVILIDKSDFTNYEVKTINTVSSATLTTTALLSATWTKGNAYVMPLYDYRIGRNIHINRHGARIDDVSYNLQEDLSEVPDFTYSLPATPATYQGHPVFDEPIQNTKVTSFVHPNSIIESIGKHAVDSFYDDDDTHVNMEFEVFNEGRQRLWEIGEFFDNRMGKLQPFWIPTWNRDLYPTAAIGSSDVTISVRDYDYDSLFVGNDVINRHLFIGLPDRTYVCRKITAASPTSITLDQAIGAEIRLSQVSRTLFSFLLFSRFSSDMLEFDYKKGILARVMMSSYGLVKESP